METLMDHFAIADEAALRAHTAISASAKSIAVQELFATFAYLAVTKPSAQRHSACGGLDALRRAIRLNRKRH